MKSFIKIFMIAFLVLGSMPARAMESDEKKYKIDENQIDQSIAQFDEAMGWVPHLEQILDPVLFDLPQALPFHDEPLEQNDQALAIHEVENLQKATVQDQAVDLKKTNIEKKPNIKKKKNNWGNDIRQGGVLRSDVLRALAVRLGIAISNDNFAEAQSLLLQGADVNYQKTCGNTLLMGAAARGLLQAVNFLIDAGADLNLRNKNGVGSIPHHVKNATALMMAAMRGNKDCVERLIQAGADLNAKDNSGQTALMYAAHKGYTEIIELLIDAGADLHAKDNGGWTALAKAALGRHIPSCELIIETMLGLRRSHINQAQATHFCMMNVESNGKIFIDIVDPVVQRVWNAQCLGYEKTFEEIIELPTHTWGGPHPTKWYFIQKYFPDEMEKN